MHASLLKAARRTSSAALAALALTVLPFHRAPPARATPYLSISAEQRGPRQRGRVATAVAVIDRHFDAPAGPMWHFETGGPQIPAPRAPAMPDVAGGELRGPVLPPAPQLSIEVRILARLMVALVVGGFIGMERRAANSLAGVRTFSLVSLGAAIFMSTTLVAFPTADPTRVAAAISSSVGFLGAGVMQKNNKHHRGLTTASSVWLAAALGIAAASGMFLLSFTGALSTVLIARYARFDSSLHLIRGDPVTHEGREMDEDEIEEMEIEMERRRKGERLLQLQSLVEEEED